MTTRPVKPSLPRPPQLLTESQIMSHKKLMEDCQRLCTTNINQPFANLADAVDRLLPFHVSCMTSRAQQRHATSTLLLCASADCSLRGHVA